MNAEQGSQRGWRERFLSFGYLQIAVILVLAGVALIYAQAPTEEEVLDRRGLQLAARTDDKPLVRVIRPSMGAHRVQVSGTGSIVVRNGVDLVPQVTGRVIWVDAAFQRGGAFAVGQRLLQIDPSDFELALAQAEADMQAAEANLQLTQANSEAAIANYALLNPDEPVPPLVAKAPQLDQARAQIAAAQARLDIARLDLSRTDFVLPFAGRVVESRAEVGQLLNGGQVFGQVFALDAIEAVVPVSLVQLDLLRPAIGRKAKVRVANVDYAAEVVRVSPNLDERTRFAQLFLRLQDGAQVLPGAFVDALIEGPMLDDSVLIPEAAEQLNERVWTVSGGTLRAVAPRFVNRNANGIVTEAFDVAEGVVLGTVPGATEGLAVNTVDAP